ncbi:MAG TPA: DUF6069 family protein [Dermatophilaceae bacterium]|nr:DUF6069 family protein [Dermatophilaceae bacterium]
MAALGLGQLGHDRRADSDPVGEDAAQALALARLGFVAWAGLVIAVVSIVMPLTVTASTATHLTLAPMHLVVGAVWFASLRRGVR